jgi:dihydrofolate reductase
MSQSGRSIDARGPHIHLIAAVAANGVIGIDGRLPWRLPEDLRHFKKLTLGHPVIMGRKTWESLGCKALPERENIVVTRTSGYEAPGAEIADSLGAALALCARKSRVFVIGGERLFAESMRIATGMVLTEIARAFEGDAHFPPFERSQWRETHRETHTAADGMRFDFVRYERA